MYTSYVYIYICRIYFYLMEDILRSITVISDSDILRSTYVPVQCLHTFHYPYTAVMHEKRWEKVAPGDVQHAYILRYNIQQYFETAAVLYYTKYCCVVFQQHIWYCCIIGVSYDIYSAVRCFLVRCTEYIQTYIYTAVPKKRILFFFFYFGVYICNKSSIWSIDAREPNFNFWGINNAERQTWTAQTTDDGDGCDNQLWLFHLCRCGLLLFIYTQQCRPCLAVPALPMAAPPRHHVWYTSCCILYVWIAGWLVDGFYVLPSKSPRRRQAGGLDDHFIHLILLSSDISSKIIIRVPSNPLAVSRVPVCCVDFLRCDPGPGWSVWSTAVVPEISRVRFKYIDGRQLFTWMGWDRMGWDSYWDGIHGKVAKWCTQQYEVSYSGVFYILRMIPSVQQYRRYLYFSVPDVHLACTLEEYPKNIPYCIIYLAPGDGGESNLFVESGPMGW